MKKIGFILSVLVLAVLFCVEVLNRHATDYELDELEISERDQIEYLKSSAVEFDIDKFLPGHHLIEGEKILVSVSNDESSFVHTEVTFYVKGHMVRFEDHFDGIDELEVHNYQITIQTKTDTYIQVFSKSKVNVDTEIVLKNELDNLHTRDFSSYIRTNSGQENIDRITQITQSRLLSTEPSNYSICYIDDGGNTMFCDSYRNMGEFQTEVDVAFVEASYGANLTVSFGKNYGATTNLSLKIGAEIKNVNLSYSTTFEFRIATSESWTYQTISDGQKSTIRVNVLFKTGDMYRVYPGDFENPPYEVHMTSYNRPVAIISGNPQSEPEPITHYLDNTAVSANYPLAQIRRFSPSTVYTSDSSAHKKISNAASIGYKDYEFTISSTIEYSTSVVYHYSFDVLQGIEQNKYEYIVYGERDAVGLKMSTILKADGSVIKDLKPEKPNLAKVSSTMDSITFRVSNSSILSAEYYYRVNYGTYQLLGNISPNSIKEQILILPFADSAYYIEVYGVNEHGESPRTTQYMRTDLPSGSLSTPTLALMSKTESSITIKFTNPNSSAVNLYVKVNDSVILIGSVQPSSTRTYAFHGLMPNTEYSFRAFFKHPSSAVYSGYMTRYYTTNPSSGGPIIVAPW